MSSSSSSSTSPMPSTRPPPFLLIPADRSRRSPHSTPALSVRSPPSQPFTRPDSSSLSQPLAFRAPAHAHAAHLHSIPKPTSSTRSLIIDRTLADHTAYRLAAAQAELMGGVFPLANGNNSRHEHEFFRDFVLEEGLEDLAPLVDAPIINNNNPTSGSSLYVLPATQARVPNATLATKLDTTAQGHANVLSAMLMQPPTPHHLPANPNHHTSHTHHHNEYPVLKLPHKVRARLANAILAERHFVAPSVSPPSPTAPVGEIPEIPPELAPFVALSSFRPSSSAGPPTLPGIKSFLSSSTSTTEPTSSSAGPSPSPFASFSAPGVSSQKQKPIFFGSPAPSPVSPSTARPKAHTLPSFTEKERDVSRANPSTPFSSITTNQTRSRAPSIPYTLMMPRPGTAGSSSDKTAPVPPLPKSMTTNWTNSPTSGFVFNGFVEKSPTSPLSATGVSPFSSSTSVTAYPLFATPLQANRRCARHLRTSCSSHTCTSPSRSGVGKATIGAGLGKGVLSTFFPSPLPNSPLYTQNATLRTLVHFLLFSAFVYRQHHAEGLNREWYGILALLVERAVLEGYLRCGWRGGRAGEVLFGLGGGASYGSVAQETAEEDEEEEEFTPDSWPALQEAMGVLFGGDRKKTRDCKEFLSEMRRRRDEFFSPAKNMTLAQHLEALNSSSSGYTSEALSRFLSRFIYAIESSFSLESSGDMKAGMKRYFSLPPPPTSPRSRGASPTAAIALSPKFIPTHDPPTPTSPGGYKRARSSSTENPSGQPDRKKT